MKLAAFGPRAEEYASRLPRELNMVVFDESDFGDALYDALQRAYHSRPFFVMPIIEDRRSAVALDAVSGILASDSAYWKRRQNFDLLRERALTLDGKSQAECEALTKKERDSLSDILLTGSCTVVRSWSELTRICNLLDYRPVRTALAVAAPRTPVPRFRPRRGAKTIVVWAPELDASRAAMFAFALEELKAPVVILCSAAAQAEQFGLRAEFVEFSDHTKVEGYLDEAAALIAGSPDDPASAIELAALGLPLAACFTSGAFEYIDGVYCYDAWDYRSILRAGLSTLGGEAPTVRPNVPKPEALVISPPRLEPPVVENPPLVSVLVLTYNRPELLPRAIDSIARQTYPNIELVLVNDGGEPVDAMVAHLPRVTLVNHERNLGASEAAISAQRAATGVYITGIADDDYFFPDHISRLVYALERTGASVAASMCSESYYTPGENGAYDFIGTSIMGFRSTDPTVLLTEPYTLAISGAVTRRETWDALGARDHLASVYDDYDWNLRILEHHDFIWVAHLLANYDTRLDDSSASRKLVGDGMQERVRQLSYVWSKYPLPNRPDIETAREDLLNFYRGTGGVAPPQRGVTRIREPLRSALRLK